jgi:spermidine synthase
VLELHVGSREGGCESYLASELVFLNDRIEVKACGTQVMMAWELPLMERMAQIATMRRGDVLEVGFGMGLCARSISAYRPRSHCVIEAHPKLVEHAQDWAMKKAHPQVATKVIAGKWQDVIDTLGPFDGIAFDVFGGQGQREAFFSKLHRLLRPHGVATLWLADDKEMPHALAQCLSEQGFRWHLNKVTAVPDKRCTYTQTNEFYVPVIYKGDRS